MDIQLGNRVSKTNTWSIISFVGGIIALAPYLVWLIAYLLISNNITEIIGTLLIAIMAVNFFLPSFVIGIILGLISLITGIISLLKIKKGQVSSLDIQLTIIGVVFGVLGVIANLMFVYYFVIGMITD